MFSETNYMEQDSSKNCLASVKLIVFLNICFPCKSYAVHTINKRLEQEILSRHYISYAFEK